MQPRHLRQLRQLRLRAPEEPRPARDITPPFKKLVGGWLCLDFVNTVHAWIPADGGAEHGADDRPEGEKLGDYGTLLLWAGEADALDPASLAALEDAATRDPGGAGAALARAVRLRDALYRIFGARLRRRATPPDDLEVLERELAHARRGERLAENDGGTLEVIWSGEAEALDAVLWPVLRSTLALLSSRAALDRLRQCDGEACGWLFVDVSRGGRRRWCDMADCGNLAKVRAYRARESKGRKRRRQGGN